MENCHGLNRGSYIWGRSVHNTRIERLWYDVTRGFGLKWKNFFLELERCCGLDADSAAHIWLLHHLFLDAINEDAAEWSETWNAHILHIRGERAASPRELFMFGMIRHGPRGITHLLEPLSEDVGDIEAYGIDWAVIDDPVLIAHHNAHNPTTQNSANPFAPAHGPEQLSEVNCDPPSSPLSAIQLHSLNSFLAQTCDLESRDMLVRRQTWELALQFCSQLFQA
ncbi:hypothetical protein LXA43DRAFT_902912 [Ganoderma leucocontextum]|nr:hypothetical protein LXA43DRAFT_902912 [Ganoderma leucocontextum]